MFKFLCDEKGRFHSENGPAVEYDCGEKHYYIHGKFHRLDGPAIECSNGEKCWCLNGKEIPVSSQEEFERYLRLLVFK